MVPTVMIPILHGLHLLSAIRICVVWPAFPHLLSTEDSDVDSCTCYLLYNCVDPSNNCNNSYVDSSTLHSCLL